MVVDIDNVWLEIVKATAREAGLEDVVKLKQNVFLQDLENR